MFPIPEICGFLTEETKLHVYNTAERDEQGSKVADFFERVEDMYSEMIWQRDLRGELLDTNTNLFKWIRVLFINLGDYTWFNSPSSAITCLMVVHFYRT